MTCQKPQDVAPNHRWGALTASCLAVTVIVMDGSIVNVALPTLSERLPDIANSRLQWIVDAYLLTFASLLLAAGAAADRFGRRRALMAGLLVFAATSIGAAMASTAASLITWRALMGVGAALIFPSTLAIISDAFREPRERRLAISIWAGVSGLGVAIGPVAGGWLLSRYNWGSICLVNVPLVGAALLGVWSTARESRDPEGGALDLVGNITAAMGVFLLVWALIEGPEIGWRSAPCVMSLVSASMLLVGFVRWELHVERPMLDPEWFRAAPFSAGCIALASAFFCLFGFVFMVTQYFQFVRGYDALEAGLRTAPFAGFILTGALLASRFGGAMGGRRMIPGGLALMAVGFAWTSGDGESTPYRLLVAQMGVLGVGLGLVNAAATEAIMGSLPQTRAGAGSSVNDTVRELGGVLGVALMGSMFNTVYRSSLGAELVDAPAPAEAKEMMLRSVGVAGKVIERIEAVAGPSAADLAHGAVVRAFMEGFQGASWSACAAASLGAGLVFWRMRGESANFSGKGGTG